MTTPRKGFNAKRRRFTEVPGFTDRPRLPRLGKLRLGEKRKSSSGKEYPAEIDYFRLDLDASLPIDTQKEIRNRFVERYGEKPVEIDRCQFISDQVEDVHEQALNWYGAAKLLCHGDGDTAERLDRSSGQWEDWMPCANNGCPQWQSGDCAFVSRTRFLLPDISLAGYFQIDSGSKTSASNIRGGIELLFALSKGNIRRIPFTLTRAPQKILDPDGKAQTHYIVSLWAPQVTAGELRQIEEVSRLALPEPEAEPEIPDVAEDIPEEIIPASAQEPEPETDDETEARIEKAFEILNLNKGTRAAMRQQFPDPKELLAELIDRYHAQKQLIEEAEKEAATA